MRRIVVYSAVRALAVLMALCLVSDPVQAQQCRRSCDAGEERDARGCCIPGKTAQQKKKERAQKAERERRARKEREKAAAERRRKAAAERRKKEQAERAAREERAKANEASQTQGDKGKNTQALEGTKPATTDPAVKSRDRGKKGEVKRVDREPSESSSSAGLDGSVAVPETPKGPLKRRWATWIPWSVVGAGATLFVTGGVLEWQAVANGNSFDEAFSQLCGTIGCFESESLELNKRLEKAELQQRLGVAFFITGGATIVTGLALAYLNRPTEVSGAAEASETAGESSSNVSLVPIFSPSATGMAVHIRF